MFNQCIKKFFQNFSFSTKFCEFNKQKNILEAKTSIKLLVGKNFHYLPTIYFQTSPKCEIFVGKNVCQISSLFTNDVFTDKVTH